MNNGGKKQQNDVASDPEVNNEWPLIVGIIKQKKL